MIKHSKVRLIVFILLLLVFFVVESIVVKSAPTVGVENKSVNEQVCIQQTSKIEDRPLIAGAIVFKSNPYALESISTTKEDIEELQATEFSVVGWTSDNVNVRSLPSLSSGEIYTTLPYNTEINYYNYNTDWVVINYNNDYAFVYKGLISDEELYGDEYIYDGEKLTRSIGTVSGPSGKETYYNLPMGTVVEYMKDLGYDYSYWVREDGCKMYGNYIMVATDTNRIPKGSLIKTSLGWGMVCDHCESASNYSGTWLDIAVTW